MTEDRSVFSRSARDPDEVLQYGEHADQVIDYWPAKSTHRSLVAFIHGGFWRPDFDRGYTRPLCAALSDLGWPAVSIEYRREPGRPDSTTADIRTALERLPDLIDLPGGYVLSGHSAGGQLALWAAATLNPVHARSVLVLAPVADLLLAAQQELDQGAVRDFIGSGVRNDLDPVHLPAPIAPVTILHGTLDQRVPLALSESYLTAHPTAQLITLPEIGHFEPLDPQHDAFHRLTTELTRLTG